MFWRSLIKARNKSFTLVGHVVYCVSVLSPKLNGTNIFVLSTSFAQNVFAIGVKNRHTAWILILCFYRTVKHCQALSKDWECERSAVKNLNHSYEDFLQSLTDDWPSFWALPYLMFYLRSLSKKQGVLQSNHQAKT